MKSSERRRVLWKKRFQVGLCVYCGKNKHVKSKKGCVRCLENKSDINTKYCKANKYARMKIYKQKRRNNVIQKYGGKCECCGESAVTFLTIDHRNNDGWMERKNNKINKINGFQWLVRLEKGPIRKDLGILCWNCNMAKQIYGVCPHQSGVFTFDFSLLETDNRRNKIFNRGTKIKWPEDNVLLDMIRKSNCQAVSRQLGVHDTTIRGRLKRRGLYTRDILHH